MTQSEYAALRAHGVGVEHDRVLHLEHAEDRLLALHFQSRPALPRDALFLHVPTHQRAHMPQNLGCSFDEKGAVQTGELAQADHCGLYVAGDAAHEVNFVTVAAAEGLKAAMAINQELRRETSLGHSLLFSASASLVS